MKTKQRRSNGYGRGIVQACNYPSRLMKTKQRRSNGYGRGIVQACNYPSRLMKTKQRRSDGHGLVEYKHATILADL